jgi:hypothetical protein
LDPFQLMSHLNLSNQIKYRKVKFMLKLKKNLALITIS